MNLRELDRNPWLLGVQNGVVDLRTGTLQTDEAAVDFVTKRSAVSYAAEAKAPRGAGSNGKSQLFETVARLLGDYAVTIPAAALMATAYGDDAERPTSVAASLAGKRLAIASESKDGAKLDVGLVKSHTGDAKVRARFMRQDSFEFDISHKLVLLTNHRPALDHLDDAIRGRLDMIPFDRKWNRPGDIERDSALPDGDKTLGEALRNESEGILAWLVRGVLLYQKEGLAPPPEVLAQPRDFVLSQDHLGRWIDEACERRDAGDGEMAIDLFRWFNLWCKDEGVNPPFANPNAFGHALSRKQIGSERTRDGARRGLRCVVKPASECSSDDLESREAEDLL